MVWIFKRPGTLVIALALVTIGLGHRALLLELDNSPETFFTADLEARETYRAMVDAFGADEVVSLELSGASSGDPEDLLALARLTREVEGLEGVSGALSISKVFDSGAGPLPARLPEEALEDVADEVRAFPLYRELGLVRAGSLGVLATTVVGEGGATDRVSLNQALVQLEERFEGEGRAVTVAGLTPTHAAFDRETRRALLVFMPAVVLVSLLVGLLLFRSFRALVALFAPPLAAVVLGAAGLELAGQSLNLLTAILPPLVLAIGFAAAIHLVTHYGSALRGGLAPAEAAQRTLRDKLPPTVLAITTTAVGFGSLALSSVSSVRILGAAAAGTLLVTLVMVSLGTPALLILLRPRLHAPAHRQRLLERLAVGSLRRRPLVLAASAVVFAVILAGLPRLEQSINGVETLPAGTPERVAYEQMEAEGLGLGNLELWLRTDQVRSLEDLGAERPRLRRLADRLEAIDGVTATLSVADLLDIAEHRLARLEARTGDRGEALRRLGGDGAQLELLSRFWQRRAGLRLTVLTLTADDPDALEGQRQLILAAAEEAYPPSSGAAVALTGHYSMLIGTPGALMATLASSLSFTVVIVFILFAILLRSVPLALAGMFANLLPVAGVLGLMGWLGVSLDVATVMTGSVVFGLAVDDTLHYLYHRRKTGSIRCAAAIAGQGIVATTMVIALGFAVLGLTGFVPVMSFGLLSALGVLLALAVDALLLPALVGRRAEALDGGCSSEGARPSLPTLADSPAI